ncbi:hypothetical protein ASE51_22710 [Bacillus sp. Root147]|nr:hypothetical protein ASE51_22710 [Bacillus sp. Root147]
MFFNKDLVLASIKAVGEDHAIVQYRDQEVEVNLSPEEAKEFHQYEQELEELKGISYQEEEDDNE